MRLGDLTPSPPLLRGEGADRAQSERPLGDQFTILVEKVGRGSVLLAESRVGDRLDLLGPLGRGFALHPLARRILLVAGGIGVAPLVTLAHEALHRGIEVTLLFGARTVTKVFPATLLPPEIEYLVHTDDGSMGRHGLVTDSLPPLLAWADQVFACGPLPMFRALAKALQQPGIVASHGAAAPAGRTGERRSRRRNTAAWTSSPPSAQVSLEQHMGCAMGACYGCVVETTGGRQRVCRDGPVFDLFEVEWW